MTRITRKAAALIDRVHADRRDTVRDRAIRLALADGREQVRLVDVRGAIMVAGEQFMPDREGE